MIRAAHVIETADARAGGTTTAFIGILDSIATLAGKVQTDAYFLTPPRGDQMYDIMAKSPERFHTAPTRGKLLSTGELGKLAAADIAAGKYDVLHLHGLWCPDLAHAARAARKAGVATIWQTHGMLIQWALNHKKWKKKACLAAGLWRLLKSADGFVTMTSTELETTVFPANCPPDRRFLVPLPVNLPPQPDRAALGAKGRERYKLPPDAFVFAFLGRLHPVKRVDMTIAAFAKAAPSIPNPRLLILGKGDTDEYENQLKAQCESLGVADKVIFAGWMNNELKPEALAAADALVLNSSVESFGYVLFEAMGVGTPVLVTSSIFLASEFKAAGAAMVADDSTEALARAMTEMASRPDRAAMAARARKWTTESFSPEAVGGQFLKVYETVRRKR